MTSNKNFIFMETMDLLIYLKKEKKKEKVSVCLSCIHLYLLSVKERIVENVSYPITEERKDTANQ